MGINESRLLTFEEWSALNPDKDHIDWTIATGRIRNGRGAAEVIQMMNDRPDPTKAWIITYTGKKFYHLKPSHEMVDIEDIAHALSMLCRWTGHTKFHYSVAQHSVYASQIVRPQYALDALLHDSSEAYLGDMNRPLKHFTAAGPAYREIEHEVERVIFLKYGVTFPLPEAVKDADTQMLYAEKAQLMNVTESTQYESKKWGRDETEANIQIEQWTPRRAKKMFLRRFAELTKR